MTATLPPLPFKTLHDSQHVYPAHQRLNIDLVYAAWHAVGADVAGVNWGKFVDALGCDHCAAAIRARKDEL